MSFFVHSYCAYYTRPREAPPQHQDTYHAIKFIKAIKRYDFSGYAWIPAGGRARRLDESTKHLACDWFGEVAALGLWLPPGAPVVLVPIPSSVATNPGMVLDSAPCRLATAIAQRRQGVYVEPLLWWLEPMQSARSGGSRDGRFLASHLMVGQSSHDGAVAVLIDDVITSGGHMQAAEYVLRGSGLEVLYGVCAGRRTLVEEEQSFRMVQHEYEQL